MKNAINTKPTKTLKKKSTFGFYHVALMGQWKWVVEQQVSRIAKSGLYDATEQIFVSALGDKQSQIELTSMLPPKYQIIHRSDNMGEFEFPTLIYMYDFCQNTDCNVWYIHTKGVSYSNRKRRWYLGQAWRLSMEDFVIDQHRKCAQLLEHFDTCGTRWEDDTVLTHRKWRRNALLLQALSKTAGHFGGNFWWSKSSYIKTLPDLRDANRNNRFECEAWVGEKNCLAYDDHNPQSFGIPQRSETNPDPNKPKSPISVINTRSLPPQISFTTPKITTAKKTDISPILKAYTKNKNNRLIKC